VSTGVDTILWTSISGIILHFLPFGKRPCRDQRGVRDWMGTRPSESRQFCDPDNSDRRVSSTISCSLTTSFSTLVDRAGMLTRTPVSARRVPYRILVLRLRANRWLSTTTPSVPLSFDLYPPPSTASSPKNPAVVLMHGVI